VGVCELRHDLPRHIDAGELRIGQIFDGGLLDCAEESKVVVSDRYC